ncbi:hypothetical protein C3B58_17355 [Lactonifactor longoviformis]|nr:hypothetical protein C3B58_17355 [Lactonifactor longoviformis]
MAIFFRKWRSLTAGASPFCQCMLYYTKAKKLENLCPGRNVYAAYEYGLRAWMQKPEQTMI